MHLLGIAIASGLFLSLAAPAAAQVQSDGRAFVEAVRDQDGDKALGLLHTQPALIDTRDDNGDTALIIAIRRSDRDWTGVLLRSKPNLEAAARNGDTPLIIAARVGFLEAVDWLTAFGAKVDSTNKIGETPLIAGVMARDARVVRKLLEEGADPDKTDYAGYSARDYAARDNRSRQMADIIKAKKPKP